MTSPLFNILEIKLMEALAPGSISASAVVVARGSALEFEAEAFVDLLDSVPALVRGIVQILTAQLRDASAAR